MKNSIGSVYKKQIMCGVVCAIIFLCSGSYGLYSFTFRDLTTDNQFIIEIDNTVDDASSDSVLSKDDSTADPILSENNWYLRHQILITHYSGFGLSGTKDFYKEEVFVRYRFKSNNRHAFAIRSVHQGYGPGIFTGNMKQFTFVIMGGFEYFFKIFSNNEGLSLSFDIGGCNNGIAFATAIGLGNRLRNGLNVYFSYLHTTGMVSALSFYFLPLEVLVIEGKIGIDALYYDSNLQFFAFHASLYIGFQIKGKFRLQAGGGLTFNEHGYFSGFGAFSLSLAFP